jgi:hypothetical protein
MNGDLAEALRCVECGRVQTASGARGWCAYLTTDEDEPAEAIVYCPQCDERELKGLQGNGGSMRPADARAVNAAPTMHGAPGR